MKQYVGIGLLLGFFFLVDKSFGQLEQPERFEYEIGVFDYSFDVVNGGDNGLMLVRATDDRNKTSERKYEVVVLDSVLTMSWKNDYYIDQDYTYRGYDYFDENYYLLFKYQRKNSQNLKIIRVNSISGDTTHFNVSNLVAIQLTEFEMTHGGALIGGYYNYSPVVIYYNLDTDKSIVLPGIYTNKSELVQLKVDDKTGNFIVLLTERTYDKRNTLAIKTYDTTGELVGNTVLEPDLDKGLVNGYTADFDLDVSLMGGTFSSKRSNYSRGIFMANINNEGEQKIEYYGYADLNNFFNYMKAKRKKRVTDRIERKKIKGRKVKLNYRLLVHDIIKDGDQYVMLGEAYYPKYSNTSNYGAGWIETGAGPIQSYGQRFVGFRYTHAVVIGFNKKGEVLWDNSFEIEDVVSPRLDQFVHVDTSKDYITLLYLYDNQIRTKIIRGNEVVEGETQSKIRLTFGSDKVRDDISEIESLKPWYNNTFFAYGAQIIKNGYDEGVPNSRRVFYVNKVRYK